MNNKDTLSWGWKKGRNQEYRGCYAHATSTAPRAVPGNIVGDQNVGRRSSRARSDDRNPEELDRSGKHINGRSRVPERTCEQQRQNGGICKQRDVGGSVTKISCRSGFSLCPARLWVLHLDVPSGRKEVPLLECGIKFHYVWESVFLNWWNEEKSFYI